MLHCVTPVRVPGKVLDVINSHWGSVCFVVGTLLLKLKGFTFGAVMRRAVNIHYDSIATDKWTVTLTAYP